ncbi:mycothione reductase [Corynebacterium sp. zg-331]|nr:mycothione reductase [Corynebacterium sp. zg-331]MPV51836.1 mycothione reductase [Corynebacterium sp. zg331]
MRPHTKHYDLIVIGSGSGNTLPPEFEDLSIALVEEARFGGTCLNVGCIPTKMYVHAADLAFEARNAARLGVHAQVTSVDWPGIVSRVFDKRIDPISRGGEAYRRGAQTPNIDVYDRHAVFVGERTLRTGQGEREAIISADNVVIAAGSRPMIPPVIADSGVEYHTNETIMRLPEQPDSLLIVGSGSIAMEFAHVFEALGTRVTIVNRSNALLRHLDEEISREFTALAQQRYDVRLNTEITGLRQGPDGTITATLSDGSSAQATHLLVATGRIPNGDRLEAQAGGVSVTAGRVEVDEYGRSTTAPGVWALGDVSSPYLLKHAANAEARAVWHNLRHPEDLRPLPHSNVPAAVFTHPQIATVGLTEDQARSAGIEVAIKVQKYGDVAYGWAMEDTTGLVKLVADRATGRLLGAHLMGPQAATLIQQLVTLMAFDIDARKAARGQYWIHPALPEVIENALLGLDL